MTRILGEVMFDDGFVVYLNGTEIGRDAMPAGPITASTRSTGHDAGNRYAPYDWSAARALLVEGANTIAVEVHQLAPSSSDLVFDLAVRLDVAPPPPPPPAAEYGISKRSVWSYWDRGGDLGTAWREPGYDDGAWSRGAGPLGYGESYVATTVDPHVTTYFRKTFLVENRPFNLQSVAAEVMYDDGYVVYLNGHEIARKAMPAGPVTASTLSTGHESGNAYEFAGDWTQFGQYLVEGENVLAVEVHQVSGTSSDLTFDLELRMQLVLYFDRHTSAPLVTDLRDPSVVQLADGTLVMYASDDFTFDNQIYRATSPDGLAWDVDPAPVWRGMQPAVLFDGTTWRIYYTVETDGGPAPTIALATSTDGVHFTAQGTVLRGGDGGWEQFVFNPTVLRDGALYKMWYEALHAQFGVYKVGYATSPDGVAWTKRATYVLNSPAPDPVVLLDHGEYRMWYTGQGNIRIEVATSRDGVDWTQWSSIPVLDGDEDPDPWDAIMRSGAVIRDGDQLRMWYFGTRGDEPYGIGYATHP